MLNFKDYFSTIAFGLFLLSILFFGDAFISYQISLYLIYGLVAQGIGLVWGKCGLMPLGQSFFFGIGAYISAYLFKNNFFSENWFILASIAALIPSFLAYSISYLLFYNKNTNGPYFSLITLAFCLLGYHVVHEFPSIFGGFNGISGIPDIPGTDRYSDSFIFVSFVVFFTSIFLTWLNKTPLTTIWKSISINENRLQLFGYSTHKFKALIFAISGFLSGLSGFLYAIHQGIVTPTVISPSLSAELLILTAIGGRFSTYGPLFGALIIGILSSYLRKFLPSWELFIALLFILTILISPAGLHGLLSIVTSFFAKLFKFKSNKIHQPNKSILLKNFKKNVNINNFSAFNVGAKINNVTVLNNFNLSILNNGIHCIIGSNGAGKSSLFNAITGHIPLSFGTIKFNNKLLSGLSVSEIARMGVGRKLQLPTVFDSLSVRDNLLIALWSSKASTFDFLRPALYFWKSSLLNYCLTNYFFLNEKNDRPALHLSQGERQTLELIMSILPEPGLLLLDEPCAGLSKAETQKQLSLINFSASKLGCVVLLIEHDLSAVESISDYVHLIHNGSCFFSGTYSEFKNSDPCKSIYTGGYRN